MASSEGAPEDYQRGAPWGDGVAGIGGLNIDYVVSASEGVDALGQEDRAAFDAALVPGSEAVVDEALFARRRESIPPALVQARAGGSSFNALRTLRRLSPACASASWARPGLVAKAVFCARRSPFQRSLRIRSLSSQDESGQLSRYRGRRRATPSHDAGCE